MRRRHDPDGGPSRANRQSHHVSFKRRCYTCCTSRRIDGQRHRGCGLTKRFGSLTAVTTCPSASNAVRSSAPGQERRGQDDDGEILEGYQSPTRVGSRCSVSTPRKGRRLEDRIGSSCKTRISTPSTRSPRPSNYRRLLLTSRSVAETLELVGLSDKASTVSDDSPADSAVGSTWPSASSARRNCSSSMNRRPASTRRLAESLDDARGTAFGGDLDSVTTHYMEEASTLRSDRDPGGRSHRRRGHVDVTHRAGRCDDAAIQRRRRTRRRDLSREAGIESTCKGSRLGDVGQRASRVASTAAVRRARGHRAGRFRGRSTDARRRLSRRHGGPGVRFIRLTLRQASTTWLLLRSARTVIFGVLSGRFLASSTRCSVENSRRSVDGHNISTIAFYTGTHTYG